MSVARQMATLVVCCAVLGCVSIDPSASAHFAGASASSRQVLVMLRMPPQHFQPGVDYAGSYGVDTGRGGRRRIASALAREYGLKLDAEWPMQAIGIDCFAMESPSDNSVEQIAEALSRDPRVEWAQPSYRFRAAGERDPLYALQPSVRYWHLSEIHSVTTGRNVRVAVVDSGIDSAHPDLAGQVADEENFVDDSRYAPETHGTAVAGIIAARSGNGIGIEGIAPNARLLAMRACWEVASDDTECSSFTLGKALHAALLKDVQVINLSLSGPADPLIGRLLDAALTRNIKVIAAADQHSRDGGFPAAHPGVLAVGDGTMRTGSADGLMMIAAPGRDIPTTLPGGRWDFVSGASFAAAHVSGLVALLTELRPALTTAEVRQAVAERAGDTQAVAGVDTCALLERLTAACACSCLKQHTANAHP
jgi:hypothetical protein